MSRTGQHAPAGPAQRPSRSPAFQRIVVPLGDAPESRRALEIACQLAGDERSSIVAVAPIELPRELPLGAHVFAAEHRARGLLQRARAVADAHGIRIVERVVRTHDIGEAVVAEAERCRGDVVVIGAPRSNRRRPVSDPSIEVVLKHAPCRVLVVAPPEASHSVRLGVGAR